MKIRHLVPAVSVLALGLAACGPRDKTAAVSPPAAPAAKPSLGPAPPWRLQDTDGKWVSSDQFKGKVVVLDFWATWCPPCRAEIPGYVRLQQKYGQDGLVFVGVSLDQEGVKVVKRFMKRYRVNYPVVMGTDAMEAVYGHLAGYRDGMDRIPITYLIDRDGIVRDRQVGMAPADKYEQRLLPYLRAAAD